MTTPPYDLTKVTRAEVKGGALRLYDTNGNLTYREDSTGFWVKRERDADGKATYRESSDGTKRGTPRSATPGNYHHHCRRR